jgi:formate dehydrogenase beta subunit
MATLSITIDGQSVPCAEGSTILQAADAAGIYIPRMCHHPDLPPVDDMTWVQKVHQGTTEIVGGQPNTETEAHCNLCLVEIGGQSEPVNSCITPAEDGMVIRTDSDIVISGRKQALARLLADHPHACLTCAQKEGCSRTDCSSNVAVEERCCVLLGRCELEKVADFIGIPGDTQRYIPVHRPVITDDPLYIRDYNLCIGCLRCVRVCTLAHRRDILGATWKDGRAWVGTVNGASLKEAQCRFCGACIEICPTGALRDKEGIPAVRRDAPVPCAANCPAGIDIPQYVQAIASGNFREALDIIRSRVPFPGILGYVCFHPCEGSCRRGELDQPVAICDLKRFVADNVLDEASQAIDKLSQTGKKVAIVGSGPAGLTAAYYLACQGHSVDIFDRESKPGGMLRYGIPNYRLPADVLERELKVLDNLGISLHMDHPFNGGDPAADLKSQGFDAVLIAAGVPVSKKLSIENSESEGIYAGLEFLKAAKSSKQPRLDGRVVVIGGGNVAIDAAMTAVRLGAQSVDMVCLESRDEMPAHEWEIAQAEEEGIVIHTSLGPKQFTVDQNRVSGIDLKKCTRVFDNQGRFDPQYDENDISHIDADAVIVTIGQQGDPELFGDDAKISKGPGHTLEVDDDFAVGNESVFAAGDVVRGPSSVVDAIADGRKVADIIDRFLGGTGLADVDHTPAGFTGTEPGFSTDNFVHARQMPITEIPDARKSGFGLIQQTLSEPAAISEAQRCLHCYLRTMITPVSLPPEKWLPLAADAVETVPETEGVFQLLDSGKKVIRISGTADMRRGLRECLDNPGDARWFMWEANPMYTKRESELIQQYLQKYGELPGGGGDDDLDDLF